MTPEEIKKTLFEIGRSHQGKALKVYLEEKIDLIKDVSTVKTWEEAQGRIEAVRVLRSIFAFLNDTPLVNKERTKYN